MNAFDESPLSYFSPPPKPTWSLRFSLAWSSVTFGQWVIIALLLFNIFSVWLTFISVHNYEEICYTHLIVPAGARFVPAGNGP